MWDFKFTRALTLMVQTAPFIGLRAIVYFACSIITIVGFVGGAAVGLAVAPESLALYGLVGGMIVGGGIACWIVYLLREYFLYLAKAGHIAVLIELMEGRSLPKNQVAYAKDIIKEYFVDASVFFAVDQVVKGVLGVITKMLFAMGSFIPGADSIVSFVSRVLKLSLTYADEVILGLTLRTKSKDVWRTSKDGIVLYAQNFKTIAKNAFFLAFFQWALVLAVFAACLSVGGVVVNAMSSTGSQFLVWVVGFILTFAIKKALVDPVMMTCLMQVYYKVIAGQVPNPEWTAKLENASEKFRNMKEHFAAPSVAKDPPSPVVHAPMQIAQPPASHQQYPVQTVPNYDQRPLAANGAKTVMGVGVQQMEELRKLRS